MSWFDLPGMSPLGPGEPYPTFNRVSLETSSSCNRRCGFCPVSTGRRDGPHELMEWGLFEKIVGQLAELEFDGVVQHFLLNEPLNNARLRAELVTLKAAVPKCTVYLSTNGDALAARRRKGLDWLRVVEELYDAGLSTINLNVYDVGEAGEKQLGEYRSMTDEICEALGASYAEHKYGTQPRSARRVVLSDMRTDRTDAKKFDMFHERTSEQRVGVQAIDAWCARPHRHLVVRYDGVVPLCCAIDPTADDAVFAGDLKEQTILEVWNGDVMRKYRYWLQQKSRALPACDTCRHKMAYPWVFRRIDATALERERWEREQAAYEAEKARLAAEKGPGGLQSPSDALRPLGAPRTGDNLGGGEKAGLGAACEPCS